MKKLMVAAVLMLACVPLALAQGTYTQIDYPGANMTEATGINNAGDITGLYEDSAGGHGFLLSKGVYTTIDYPGAQYSYLYGINDNGQIVGLAEPLGFVYDINTQTFTAISYPGATSTYPLAINNAGTIAGYFQQQKGNHLLTAGFELAGSAYTLVGPLNANATYPWGISASGELVGYAYLAPTASYVDFTFAQSKFRQITIPHATFPLVYGTNPEGSAVVGSYEPFTGVTGFIFRGNTLLPLSFPGSITTEAYGINDARAVVGDFIDQNNATHGFTWTPSAADPKK